MIHFSPTNTQSTGSTRIFSFPSYSLYAWSVEKRAQILFQGAKLCVAFSILFKNHSSQIMKREISNNGRHERVLQGATARKTFDIFRFNTPPKGKYPIIDFVQRPNSQAYNFVEVAGHSLKSSQNDYRGPSFLAVV